MEKQIIQCYPVLFSFLLFLALFNPTHWQCHLLGLSLFVISELLICFHLLPERKISIMAYYIFGLSIYPILA